MAKPEDFGIDDADKKWVITARQIDGTGPRFTLLWRTEGPRGKPLPKIGQIMPLPGYGHVRVESIEPPGANIADAKRTLVVKVQPGKDDE